MDSESIHYMLKYENYEQLIKLFTQYDQIYRYKVLKQNEVNYQVQDCVQYKKNLFFYYGQITEIVSLILQDQKLLPLIKIKILLTFDEVVNHIKDSSILKRFRKDHLFATDEYRWIHIGELQKKIQTDKYNLNTQNNRDEPFYFIKEDWQSLTNHKLLKKQKASYCFCGNPEVEGQEWIQCEECDDWIHFQCSNLTREQFKKIGEMSFICKNCKKNTEKKVNTKKETKLRSKENQKNSKEFEDLIQQFEEMSLSENGQKHKQQSNFVKIDFEKMPTVPEDIDKDYLEWIFSQLRLYFKQKKVYQIQRKIDLIFKLLFNEKELSFLYTGICSRLGHEELTLQKEEQEYFIKSLFIDIFDN